MKTIKDLLLAALNATLILIAVCLFLFWQISKTVERSATAFAKNIHILEPVRSDLNALATEVAALRKDLAEIANGSDARASQIARTLDDKAKAIQTDIAQVRVTLAQAGTKIAEAPEELVTSAVTSATESAGQALMDLRGCSKPEA